MEGGVTTMSPLEGLGGGDFKFEDLGFQNQIELIDVNSSER